MDLFQLANSKEILFIGLASLMGLLGVSLAIKNAFANDQQEDNQFKNKVMQNKKPAGIYNEGNTCFVNSLLQALASIEQFPKYIDSIIAKSQNWNQDKNMLNQLNKIIEKINSQAQNIVAVQFLDALSDLHRNLINFQQQDAHQLYSLITHSVSNILNKNKKLDLSKLSLSLKFDEKKQQEQQNILQGCTKTSIVCTKCKNQTKISVDVFNDLSLQIQPRFILTLQQAIQWFQRKEPIQSYICSCCSITKHIKILEYLQKKYQNTNKTLHQICKDFIKFWKKYPLADQQISQLNNQYAAYVTKFTKQFQQLGGLSNPDVKDVFTQIEPVTSTIIKKTQITKYPKILIIHFKQLSISHYTGEPILLRKNIGYNDVLEIKLRTGIKKYSLTSVLTHIGNQAMGHYFTFRKRSKKQLDWFLISDSYSKQCSWRYMVSHVPYMLFYELEQ